MEFKIRKILKTFFYVLIILIFGLVLFLNFHPTFGEKSKGESLEKIQNSKNFNGEKFVNIIETPLMTPVENKNTSLLEDVWDYISPPEGKLPNNPLPSRELDLDKITEDTFTWLGHASFIMKTSNVTILTDPVFNRASPVPIFGKAFEIENQIMIEDLPEIDVVVISHDHYDHLDYKGIKDFTDKVNIFFVPLGVKAHVMKWGIEENRIIELDWYEKAVYNNIEFIATPSRHFSGRGITDGGSTLWSGWIIKSQSKNVYFSGDSGYFEEFKNIGENYGPFDIAFIDSGAYDESWGHVHMMPEESVQANIDLNSNVFFPIGWAKFDLAPHTWQDPIIRATKEAKIKNVTIATPLIGETFTLDNLPRDRWWE